MPRPDARSLVRQCGDAVATATVELQPRLAELCTLNTPELHRRLRASFSATEAGVISLCVALASAIVTEAEAVEQVCQENSQ